MCSRLFTLRSLTYLAGLVAIIALMLYLHHQARKRADSTDPTPIIRDYPEIRHEGILRLCTSYNEGGIKAQGGELSGLVYDLAKVLQQRSGLRVEVVLENNWEKALTYLSSGQVDLVNVRHRHHTLPPLWSRALWPHLPYSAARRQHDLRHQSDTALWTNDHAPSCFTLPPLPRAPQRRDW